MYGFGEIDRINGDMGENSRGDCKRSRWGLVSLFRE